MQSETKTMKLLLLLSSCFAVGLTATPRSATTVPIRELYTDNNLSNDNSTIENGRIINGVEAQRGQFPWQVAITFNLGNARKFCGGALISPQWVLTAAHCVYNGNSFEVTLGATRALEPQNGKIVMGVEKALYHPYFNQPSALNNDVAVIKLKSPVQYNNYIRAIPLPKRNYYLQPNTNVFVSGWGQTSDEQNASVNILYYVGLVTISNEQCKQNFRASLIVDSVVCCDGGQKKSTCLGDSGGPLVTNVNGVWTHVGVVSFVDSRGCSRGYPSGYSRTSSFLDFIYANTNIREQ